VFLPGCSGGWYSPLGGALPFPFRRAVSLGRRHVTAMTFLLVKAPHAFPGCDGVADRIPCEICYRPEFHHAGYERRGPPRGVFSGFCRNPPSVYGRRERVVDRLRMGDSLRLQPSHLSGSFPESGACPTGPGPFHLEGLHPLFQL